MEVNRLVIDDSYGDELRIMWDDRLQAVVLEVVITTHHEDPILAFKKREQLDQIINHLQLLRKQLPE